MILPLLSLLAAPAPAEDRPWRVDGTSLALNAGRWPIRAAEPCGGRGGVRTLGVAAVVYSRKQGTMAWGHASLRVVACVDGAVRDLEYETYRLSPWNERLLREEHAGEPFLAGDYLREQRGALVLFRNVDPVDGGWYGEAQAHNREVYELWLDRPPEALDAVAAAAAAWYDQQLAAMRAEQPLDERYRPLSTNCTAVFQRLLGAEDPPVMPFAWLRQLEGEAELRVLHPSHALVRRWGGLPGAVDRRPRPVLRRGATLPDPLRAALDRAVAAERPVGPWSAAGEAVRTGP